MTDTESALFKVRLPMGTKTVDFDDATRWIAEAKNPPSESLGEQGLELIGAGWRLEESKLEAAVKRGEVEVLDSSYHAMLPPFSTPKLEKAVLTVKAFRQYVEGIKGAVELAGTQPATDQTLDPKRRLDLLRSLGGAAEYARCGWKLKGITALVMSQLNN